MRTIKIIFSSYVGSTAGFLIGEFLIRKISNVQLDLWGIMTRGIKGELPVLLGLLLSGIIGTVAGASFIKKGKIRALLGAAGGFFGLAIAAAAIFNVSTFNRIYYIIYPLFALSGWELGIYLHKNYIDKPNSEN
ncbi:MAG: hypothetical protein IH880_00770 [Candidatus Marinimicrobia bacterium]|nr:hypothetical protein [Candidatus Neomarinimicrobiota bacterium]